jgi:hypothetical protein
MLEKRNFPRIKLATKSILSSNDAVYQGQLENISMNGALVRLEHGAYLPEGSELDLALYVNGDAIPLQLKVEIVCVSFAMAGVKFISCTTDAKNHLATLMDTMSSDSDNAKVEHERIRRRLAYTLREE